MKSSPFPASFLQSLGEVVVELESVSAVEVVVVVQADSGHYQGQDHSWGAIVAFLTLAVILYSPIDFGARWVVWECLGAYLVGMLLSRRLKWPRQLFSSRPRQLSQVLQNARAAFVGQKLASTRERTALLVFLSRFEQVCCLLPDVGVDACVGRAYWNAIEHQLQRKMPAGLWQALVLQLLRQSKDTLQKSLPRAADDVDELSNEIRVLERV